MVWDEGGRERETLLIEEIERATMSGKSDGYGVVKSDEFNGYGGGDEW